VTYYPDSVKTAERLTTPHYGFNKRARLFAASVGVGGVSLSAVSAQSRQVTISGECCSARACVRWSSRVGPPRPHRGRGVVVGVAQCRRLGVGVVRRPLRPRGREGWCGGGGACMWGCSVFPHAAAVPCASVWCPVRHAAPHTLPLGSGPMRQCAVPVSCAAPTLPDSPGLAAICGVRRPRLYMQSMVRAHEEGVCCARQQPRSCFILYPVGFQPLRWALNHRQDAHGVKNGSADTPFAQGTVAWVGAHPSPVWAACCGTLRLRTIAGTISAANHVDTRKQLGCRSPSERHLLHG